MIKTRIFTLFLIVACFSAANVFSQTANPQIEKAEAVVKRAVEKLGGERYLQVKSQISSGISRFFAGASRKCRRRLLM